MRLFILKTVGQPKEFRPKPTEGILKPSISAESLKKPKEGVSAERRVISAEMRSFGRNTLRTFCQKRLISAERGLFRPKWTISAERVLSAKKRIFAETFRHLPKPKLLAESRKRALSIDHYCHAVRKAQCSAVNRTLRTCQRFPIRTYR